MVAILLAHPEGMRVGVLARAIYNINCDLFDPRGATLFDRIYASMYPYLWRNSRGKGAPFERRGWGVYALSRFFVRQLDLCFDDWDEPTGRFFARGKALRDNASIAEKKGRAPSSYPRMPMLFDNTP